MKFYVLFLITITIAASSLASQQLPGVPLEQSPEKNKRRMSIFVPQDSPRLHIPKPLSPRCHTHKPTLDRPLESPEPQALPKLESPEPPPLPKYGQPRIVRVTPTNAPGSQASSINNRPPTPFSPTPISPRQLTIKPRRKTNSPSQSTERRPQQSSDRLSPPERYSVQLSPLQSNDAENSQQVQMPSTIMLLPHSLTQLPCHLIQTSLVTVHHLHTHLDSIKKEAAENAHHNVDPEVILNQVIMKKIAATYKQQFSQYLQDNNITTDETTDKQINDGAQVVAYEFLTFIKNCDNKKTEPKKTDCCTIL